MNVPNILTTCRIFFIPVYVILLVYEHHLAAILLFSLAAGTDFLDGYIARRTDTVSALGSFLDPLADKLLSISSFVSLSILGPVPVWLVIVLISRDLIISLGTLVLFISEGDTEVSPTFLGKASTLFQFLTIFTTLVLLQTGKQWFLWEALLVLTATLIVLSGVQYLYRGLNRVRPARIG